MDSKVYELLNDQINKELYLAYLYLSFEMCIRDSSVLDALLAPTRIYVKSILELRREVPQIHAVAHITGGGITENLNRALNDHVDAQIDEGTWTQPPIIDFVVEKAGLSREEALKTFNCGIGMCVICPPEVERAAIEQLESTGEKVFKIGSVIPGDGKVVYRG